jgi:hypothetical protein
MKDPAFLAEAERSMFDVDPLTGEEMVQILKRAYATPRSWYARRRVQRQRHTVSAPASSLFRRATIIP